MNVLSVRYLESRYGNRDRWCESGKKLYNKIKNKNGTVSICKKTFSKIRDGSSLPCPSAWVPKSARKRAFAIEKELCKKCRDCIGCYRRFGNRFWK